MFLCKECATESTHWKYELAMAISYGCCEFCEEIKPCVDQSVNYVKEGRAEELRIIHGGNPDWRDD